MSSLSERIRLWLKRHPVVRDALLWSVPALLFGLFLRALLLSYSPYGYWGKDSQSYISFAFDLRAKGEFDLDSKRRYVYPIFLWVTSYLPGSILISTAWLQHLLGVVSVVPMAYVIRRSTRFWRWLVLPSTMFYTGMPILIWLEHELLGETLYISALVFAIGGWVAWVSQENKKRAGRLWWIFLAAFAVVVLTKPSARFFWPGLLVGLVMVRSWRVLNWKHWASLAALFVVGMTVGNSGQGARLLYTSAFPLTRLDTPLHAEYKEEIRDMVEPLRKHIASYYGEADEDFLKNPHHYPGRPKWAALRDDRKLQERIYKDLAIEGIKARPDLFFTIALQRVLTSMNPRDFKAERLTAEFYPVKLEPHFREQAAEVPDLIRFVFNLSSGKPIPEYAAIAHRLSPRPESWQARALPAYVEWFYRTFAFVYRPPAPNLEEAVWTRFRPAWMGWWLLAAIVCSLLPRYWRRLGPWMVIGVSYGLGVYLVGSEEPRYFAPAWPVIAILLAVPVDALLTIPRKLLRKPDASS